MHVPVLMMIDKHFEQHDTNYESVVKEKKRRLMVMISFAICLFWGGLPLLGWTPMTFEPSGLSCAVYQAKPDMFYISYITFCFLFFEFIPLVIVIFCKVKAKKEEDSNNKVFFLKSTYNFTRIFLSVKILNL